MSTVPVASPWSAPEQPWPLPWWAAVWPAVASQQGHALMLQGPDGHGLWALAALRAQAWLCERPQAASVAGLACGACEGCHLLAAGVHPDMRWLVPEAWRLEQPWLTVGEEPAEDRAGKAKPSKDIRVAEVRSAIEWSQRTPSRGRLKVLVVCPAERLNAVAANALLKTLEEPPASLKLLLVTHDGQALLPTVRSRCQQVSVPGAAPAQAAEWLKRHPALASPAQAQAEPALAASGGRPLEAWQWLQDGFSAAQWAQLPQAVQHGQAQALTGWPVVRAVASLQKLCHDLMARAQGGQPRYFGLVDLPDPPPAMALQAWWKALQQASAHREHPLNGPLLLESLVLQGQACWPPHRHVR